MDNFMYFCSPTNIDSHTTSMKNILIRAASGAIYVGLIVASIVWGKGYAYPLLCALLGALAVMEFNRISLGAPQSRSHRVLLGLDVAGCVLAIAGITLGIIGPRESQYLFSLCLLPAFLYLIVRPVAQLYVTDGSDSIRSLTTSLGGYVYISLPLICSGLLYKANPGILLALFIMIWCNDTGAYLSGITMGRHKLFERISPKKTWEGFFGGMVFCTAAAAVCRLLFTGHLEFHDDIALWNIMLLGVTVSIVATWGDLVESLLKRSANIKDSGHIIPGHGGILDRIDSLLLVMPWALLWLALNNCI